jgi:hypothetical protein
MGGTPITRVNRSAKAERETASSRARSSVV